MRNPKDGAGNTEAAGDTKGADGTERSAPGNAWGTFLTVWVGQFVSTLGSSLTAFAAAWWVFERTGSVTQFSLTVLFEVLPFVALSPFAGVLVDRYSRRRVMLLSDTVAAASSAFLLLLLLGARLEVWHVYLATLLNSVANVFQGPAYSASITLLVPKERLSRANGLVQLSGASGRLVAPVVAGFLLVAVGLEGVIALDLATFAVALVTLLSVRFPRLEKKEAPETVWREAMTGWRYLKQRRGLLNLALFYALYNFLNNFGLVLTVPLLLSFASAEVLGVVLSVGGAGMVVGGLVMATWGPSQRLVKTNLGFLLLSGVGIVLVGLRPSAPLIAAGLFVFYFAFAVSGAAGGALFQRKVAREVQGRVFATRQMLGFSAEPFAYLLVGPLAEFVFTPLLMPGGGLAGSVGRVLGVGNGRGMGLLTVLAGLLIVVLTMAIYLLPSVRRLEKELPDEV